ncbi:hypothetical protein N802_07075 [Knoellia sinensis KCTC 19936]|uniref:Polyketide cyclase n=1 Tax=Knoellia sinensis KCTC 19936 TaxID=1385520 RepID=A0A0A0J117_9MICO|nr:SRPBCC family protein [Knoellia sinensis]KGN30399.1 hypothetical protein N802_07075 [Knoellia sinensis KCTC 19936]
MGEREYSVWIQAAPNRVWSVYVDPARLPEWQTGRPVVGDLTGPPGSRGSGYTSRRGPLRARTTVVSSDPPRELVTRTEAYFGLAFDVTSVLTERGGGTDLVVRATTHWRPRLAPVGALVEAAILSPREARKELANLKILVEGEESGPSSPGLPLS